MGGKKEPTDPGNASALDIGSLLGRAGAPSTEVSLGRNKAAEGKQSKFQNSKGP